MYLRLYLYPNSYITYDFANGRKLKLATIVNIFASMVAGKMAGKTKKSHSPRIDWASDL